MGGKTQQRVAGNVKPSNSGRIRELLMNQQQGTSNVITFSALSKNKHQQSKTKNEKQNKSKKGGLKESHQATNDEITASSSTTTKDNYKLIVKRVGDREMYTRVRFSDTIQYSDDIRPAISPIYAGVKKPAYIIDSCLKFEKKNESNDKISTDETVSDDKDDNKSEDEIHKNLDFNGASTCDPDDDLNFYAILDRLTEVQAQSETTSADSVNALNEEQIKYELQLLKFFRLLVEKFSSDLSIEDWDLIVRSLYKWIGWISKSELPLRESWQADLCINVFNFIRKLIQFAKSLAQDKQNQATENPMMQSLLDDWNNFHSSNLFQDLLVLYFKLISIENNESKERDFVRTLIESLAQIVVDVDPRMVLSHYSLTDHIKTNIEFDQELEVPANATFCNIDEKHFKGFSAACSLLRSNFRVILMSAHTMLRKSISNICEATEASKLIPEEEDIDGGVLMFPPAILMSILTSRDSMMSALLSDYNVGDVSVTIEPNTDSYACTLSYLFAWDLAIQIMVGIDKEFGHRIVHSLKRLGLIQRLLDNIFRLLPPLGERDSLNFKIATDGEKTALPRNHRSTNLQNFLKGPLLTTIKRPINEIELVALHLYFSVALHLPVTVRKWYNNNANKKLCNLVNEYTVKHISQVICSLEMESVQKKCQQRLSKNESKNLTIKARPSAKEVFAIYTRDEFKMELTIKLPYNYPLGPIQIDGGKRVGVTDNKWRSWLLQLTTFLSHQNGPILDGIDLWKKNLDKRFEGVEKCTICFSILHSNYQLPKKKCQTCANMFHNLCLYKWFESSGNSTCPLCRNAW